jgi:hypothetical protein
VSYTFLIEDYIPILEAASLLAFGDRDYEKHYKRVEVWTESGLPPEFVAEVYRRRREEIEQGKSPGPVYVNLEGELDERGRYKKWARIYPEIQHEIKRLHQLAAAGEITIIALPPAVTTWDHVGDTPIGVRYLPIPAEFFHFNEWEVVPVEPFPIEVPFDLATKIGGTSNPEWFYPAVKFSDIRRLQDAATSAMLQIEREGEGAIVGATVAQERACRKWLIGLMQDNLRPVKAKEGYQREALHRFGISKRGFNRSWSEAILETGSTNWSKPGRKS